MTHERFNDIVTTLRRYITGTKYQGHVFCVGGCVRDLIMGEEIKDIDLVVDLPDGGINLAAFLCNKGVLKHTPVTYPTYGTAMFKLNKFPEDELEAVQTRKEQYKDSKSRNPETSYGSLEEDAFRRDLTINALYYNIDNGIIIDPTGKGRDDIANKLIRTTSKPDIIFSDDPLRMLRCLRFACRFGEGWRISKETMRGIGFNAMRLSIITRERIQDELNKILLSPSPQRGFIPIIMYGMDRIIFKTEFNTRVVKWGKANGIYIILKKNPDAEITLSPLELGLCAILITVNSVLRKGILKELRYSNDITNKVISVLEIADKILGGEIEDKLSSVRKAQYTYSKMFYDAVVLSRAYEIGSCGGTNNSFFPKMACRKLREKNLEMYDYTLPVGGQDVIDILGIPAGKEVGEKLSELLDVAAKYPNLSKEDMVEYLKEGESILEEKEKID